MDYILLGAHHTWHSCRGLRSQRSEGDGFDRDDAVSGKCEAGDQQSILNLLCSSLFDMPSLKLDNRRAGYLEKILTMLFRKNEQN